MPFVPIQEELRCVKEKSILSSSMPTSSMSFEPISKLIPNPDNPNGAASSKSYDDLIIDYGDSLRHPRHESHEGHKSNQGKKQQQLENLSTVVSQEWLDEAKESNEITKMPIHVKRISCQVMGIFSKVCYDPSLGINNIPNFHSQGSSKNHLLQSQKHLRLPKGQVLDCSGVLQGIPMVIDDLKTFLDFHIFDLPGLYFHLTFIGRPMEQILENALGNEKLGHGTCKQYLHVWTFQPLSRRVESRPVLDPRGEPKMVSQATMTYPSLEEDLECHEKESSHPLLEMENFINEYGSYTLILSSSPFLI